MGSGLRIRRAVVVERRFRPFVGRFRCPDGRIVRLVVDSLAQGSHRTDRRRGRWLPAHRLQKEAAGVQPRSSGEGGGGERQAEGLTGVEHLERLHTRADPKGEKGVSNSKNVIRLNEMEEVLKSDREARLILCGVVVNIFTSEVVRRAVYWSASRRRGCSV